MRSPFQVYYFSGGSVPTGRARSIYDTLQPAAHSRADQLAICHDLRVQGQELHCRLFLLPPALGTQSTPRLQRSGTLVSCGASGRFQQSPAIDRALIHTGMVQALKVLKVCDENPKNEKPIDYDERNPFVVCGITLAPIYRLPGPMFGVHVARRVALIILVWCFRGSPMLRCSYCSQPYVPEQTGKLCTVCGLGQVIIVAARFWTLLASTMRCCCRWASKRLD